MKPNEQKPRKSKVFYVSPYELINTYVVSNKRVLTVTASVIPETRESENGAVVSNTAAPDERVPCDESIVGIARAR